MSSIKKQNVKNINFKNVIFFPILNFVYVFFSFVAFLIIFEYIHSIVTNFERFKMMHSISGFFYDISIIASWVIFSISIVKYDKKLLFKNK